MTHSSSLLGERDRVLLIRLGAVGDVLRTLPALHLIRRTFPATHLAWIVEDLSRDLLEGHPEIDELIRFPVRELRAVTARPTRLWAGLASLSRSLRARQFSVAVDFQGSFKSGLVACLSGAPRRLGFAAGHCREMSFLLSNQHVRPPSRTLNRVEKNLLLADHLGAVGDEVTALLPEREEDGRRADAILRELVPRGRAVVLLSPGTSRRQRHKRWPAEYFARLASLMRESLDTLSLVVWGPGEEGTAQAVVVGSGGAALMAPPTDLRTLAALLRRSRLFVGADTGPMHLAWLVGCPVVALFGPTDPRLNSPLGPEHVVLNGAGSTASIRPEEVVTAGGRILARSALNRIPAAAPRLSRAALFPAVAGRD
ncbi:MAG TPA: glycosyltransferase family 9 protein [Candidatus Polarisedimenticolia bacterium]|nr:glycosyltransferase family 9 protein [Candidatus Polarisedimenticolia bacterium]